MPAAPRLQAIWATLERVYDGFAFADYIYDGSPDPPLNPKDQAWASNLLVEFSRQ